MIDMENFLKLHLSIYVEGHISFLEIPYDIPIKPQEEGKYRTKLKGVRVPVEYYKVIPEEAKTSETLKKFGDVLRDFASSLKNTRV